ncbi:MAG: hypothetical protein JRI68_34680 [Deltaproteobacteria bacterium]|nr:hypothetical protein [Deltaproteobacteria bacterium]
MRSEQLAFSLVATLALVGPSCGGKAVVDPGAGIGGTGGSSTSSSGTGGTSTSSSGTGGTGEGTIAQACAEVCAILDQCGQTEPGCATSCQTDVMTGCETEYLAFLQCLASFMSPPSCELPPYQCESAMDAYVFCDDGPTPPCEPGPCYSGSDGSCGCEIYCVEGTYGTDCVPSGGSTVTCTCSIDGSPIGSCSQPMGMEACDVYSGCCAPMFFDWE